MRNTKTYTTVISALTALLMMCAVSTTVFATGELGTLVPPVDDAEGTYVYIEETTAPQPEYEFETEVTENYTDDNYYEEYIEETEEVTEPPTYYEVYGDELPQVESQEITEPTIAKIPEVEVSDTSLIGGVIMWLCVALGIAVIAGVLVSQRTRQISSSQNSRDDRMR